MAKIVPLADFQNARRPGAVSVERRLAAVAFVDIVGYAALLAADEDATLREWSALQRNVIEPCARSWNGRILNRAGDGLLLEFRSALEALRWAAAVQKSLLHAAEGARIALRIALHLGDIADAPDGQVHGEGVAIASRLQAHARPGGVIVSDAIANEVAGRLEFFLSAPRTLRLKGIARPVKAFNVEETQRKRPRAGARLRSWAIGTVSGAALIVAAIGAASWLLNPARNETPHERAERLTRQGRALVCHEVPCPTIWLEARALYEKAIAADPGYGPAYGPAALTYTNIIANHFSLNDDSDLRNAERLATQALALAPDDAMSWRARGAVLLLEPDRSEDALEAYVHSLSIDPNQPVARANVGWIMLLLGRAPEAQRYLEEALATRADTQNEANWRTDLGLAELFQDVPGHGADDFRKAIAARPLRGNLSGEREMYLAAALALDGRIAEARNVVAELRKRGPVIGSQAIWACACSTNPRFLAGVAVLKRGLVLAGLDDGS